MSKERTLANIARTAYWTISENHDTFDRIAKAVEAEVLARLNKSEVEPVAGQELSFVQVAQWVEKHGSTNGLQWRNDYGKWWKDEDVTTIYASAKYRVAPKKVNDPDDPTTWEKGIKVFVRYDEHSMWALTDFAYYDKFNDKFVCYCDWNYAKLATPEQIEAWKLINDDL